MRLSTALKLVAVAVAGGAVALISVAKSIDFNQYKDVLAAQVQAQTGRTLTISGPLELKLGLTPSLSATGIAFSNAAWGSRPQMLTAESLKAEVDLLPLLARRVQIHRLALFKPDILLEIDRHGRGNWEFDLKEGGGSTPGSAATPPTSFDIRELKISEARLGWSDRRQGSGGQLTVELLKLRPQAKGVGALDLSFYGAMDGMKIALTGSVGRLSQVTEHLPLPLHLGGMVANTNVIVQGTIAHPLEGRGFDLKLAAQGEELRDTLTAAGLSAVSGLPPLGSFKASARLSDGGGHWKLSDIDAAAGSRETVLVGLKGSIGDLAALNGVEVKLQSETASLSNLSALVGATLPPSAPVVLGGMVETVPGGYRLADIKAGIGGSDLGGWVRVTTGARINVSAALTSSHLDLADILGPPARPAPAAGERLFSDAPLSLSALTALDGRLALNVARLVVGGGSSVSNVELVAELNGGKLRVKPLLAALAGGQISAALELDGAAVPPALAARLRLDGIELGRLLHERGAGGLISGASTSARLALIGKGGSVRELMASLSGDVRLDVGGGTIHNTVLDWAGGDVLLSLLSALNPLARSEETSELRCAAVRTSISGGVADFSKGIALETAKVGVTGSGTIDLRSEQLDIGLKPKARDGLGISIAGSLSDVTRVRGSLAQPVIAVDEVGVAKTAASVGAAMLTGGLSILGEVLFDRVTSDTSTCQGTRANAPVMPGQGKGGGK